MVMELRWAAWPRENNRKLLLASYSRTENDNINHGETQMVVCYSRRALDGAHLIHVGVVHFIC